MIKLRKIFSLLIVISIFVGAFSGCGSVGSPFTVNDYKVSPFMYRQSLYAGIQKATSLLVKDFSEMTDEDMIDGKNYKDYIIDYAYENMLEQALINSYFKKLGLKFDDSDRKTLGEQLAYYQQAYGGKSNFESQLKNNGISLDDFTEYLRNQIKANKIKTSLYGENGTNKLTDDELKKAFEEKYVRVKHILLSTIDTNTREKLPEDTIKEKEAEFNRLLDLAKSGENFDSLVSTHSEDPGSTSNPDGYYFTEDSSYDEVFKKTSFSLKVDEIGSCLSSFGYHIIKRYPLNTDEFFEDENNKNSVLTEVMQAKLKEGLKNEFSDPTVKKNNSAIKKIQKDVFDELIESAKSNSTNTNSEEQSNTTDQSNTSDQSSNG